MSFKNSAGSRNLFFLLAAILLLSSCVKGKLDITLSEGVQTPEEAPLIPPAQVFDVDIDDNKLVVQGNHLNGVSSIQVTGPNGFDESFSIQEQSASELIAHATSHVAFAIGSLFSLIISDAHGSTTYTITFTLEDGQVTASKLDDMGASDGDALVYNAALETWEAMPLSGLNFRGTWDADNLGCNEPEISPSSGDYWVVSNGGTCNLDGFDNWFEGDWAIYNIAAGWQQVVNTSDVVSFNGRQGVVTPEDDDYTWEMIDLTDSTLSDIADIDITGLQDGQILKWDNILEVWYAADDEIGDSVSASDIESGAISDIHVNASADIAQSKIAGLEDDLDDLLPRDGTRAMSGNLDMGTNNITNVGEVDGVNLSALASTVGNNEGDISANATNIAANTSAITSNTNAINDLESELIEFPDPLDSDLFLDGSNTWRAIDSDDVTEANNLYFLESRVLETELAGYTTGTDSAIDSSDDVLSAFGKLQAQIDASGSGDGDFLADGSVAMTGDFDGDGNELLNIGAVELINSEDNTLTFRLPATGVADYQLVFPSQLGLEGEVLVINSTGELEWTALDTGEVDSGDIAAGAINDSHISSTAEIAQSKIAGLLDDLDDLLLLDGTRAMSGNLDMGTNNIINLGEIDGVNLSDLESTVGDNESNIATNVTAITNLETDVSANEAAIATKQDDLGIPDDATQYLDGDGTWQTLDTSTVTEHISNLYFTDERAQDAAVVNATTGSETDQAPSVAAIKAYISDEIDGLGEGDLLSDGSVSMSTDFNLDGNNLINAGNIQLIDDSDNAITLRSPSTGVIPYELVLPSELGAEDEILALNSSQELVWTPLSTGSVTAVTADLPLESSEGDTPNLTIRQASGSEDGYLSSLDWNTFNEKQDELTLGNLTESTSSVLSITGGDDSIVGSGVGIEVTRADTTNSGYLHSDDWNTFNDKQEDLGFSGASSSEFLDGSQTWRTLAAADIPNLSANKITTDTLDKDRVPAAESLNTNCAGGDVLRSDGTDLGCIASTLMGPWEHSGSDIYYDSGNVGIGTSTPSASLEVAGTVAAGRVHFAPSPGGINPGACASDEIGALRYNEDLDSMEYCKYNNGDPIWMGIRDNLKVAGNDTTGRFYSNGTYAESCYDYISSDDYVGEVGSGIYWVEPEEGVTFKVYCDMVTEGGGWTLILTENGGITEWSQFSSSQLGSPLEDGYRSNELTQDIPYAELLWFDHEADEFTRFIQREGNVHYLKDVPTTEIDEYVYHAVGGEIKTANSYYNFISCDSWGGGASPILMLSGSDEFGDDSGGSTGGKSCGSWEGDYDSWYYRFPGSVGGSYDGNPWKENGHDSLPGRLQSLFIR